MGEPKVDDKGDAAPPEKGGRVEKQVKRIAEKVDKIDARLETYEEITGAASEAERRREEKARAEVQEEIRKKKSGDDEEKPLVREDDEEEERRDLFDIW